MTKKTGVYWDDLWKQYESQYKILDFYDKMVYLWFEISGIFSRYLDKYVKKNQSNDFIELGCGGGNFLPYFKDKYCNLTIHGIDRSPEGCKIAFKRLKGQIPASNIICGDILKDLIQNKKFDIAFSFGLIEHFDNPEIALKKHVDLLKKDGILLCIVPNLLGLQGKLLISEEWFSNEDEGKSTGFIFGMKKIAFVDLKKWAKNLGLKNVEVLPVGGILPMFLIETVKTKKKSKLQIAKLMHRYILFGFLVSINVLFLFRVNCKALSPYILLIGYKN
jgi:SAM-dependent methyltransferase